jgi:hypothetical protein
LSVSRVLTVKSGHDEDGLAVMGDVGDNRVRSISNLKMCWRMTEGLWLVVRRERGGLGSF